MKYVYFGKTGMRVSELCLGTMTFGNEADEATSVAIMNRALDVGINFFDTANIYSKGASEEIIGRWLPPQRERIVLASKCHSPTGEDPNERGSSRRNIVLAVEKSLRRLKTTWLDVLYLHQWDEHASLDESLDAIDNLVRQGKVLCCAVSNFSAWQTMKAIAIAERRNFAPITGIQPMYSLIKRQVEVEILPLAQAEGLAVCPYSPAGAGVLTGKYLKTADEARGRIDVNAMYKRRYADPRYEEVSRRFIEYAARRGASPAALAVAWVMVHPAITAPIIGARNLDQFNDTLRCLDMGLSAEERAEITALSFEPPLATDRERS